LKSKGILIQDLYTLENELEQADKLSLAYANKAWNNINYNARSTYHSIIFRKMHIYYHLLGDLILAYLEAKKGLGLTAGEARTTYYFYGSRIALDLIKNYNLIKNPEFTLDELKENSEKWLKELLRFDQHKFQAYASLAYLYSQQNRWSDALNSANEASKIVPNDPNMHNIIGISAYNSGDYNLAIDELQKALQLNPANPIYHRDLGMVYMSQRKFSEAKQHFEIIINSSNCPQDIKNQVSVELEKLKYLLNNNSQGNNTNGY
jgi:tetratricopeptide (TPR) repeat protein